MTAKSTTQVLRQAAEDATKPGWTTSEFAAQLMGVLAVLLPFLFVLLRIDPRDQEALATNITQLVASVIAGYAAVQGIVAYIRGRVSVKQAAIHAALQETVAEREADTQVRLFHLQSQAAPEGRAGVPGQR